jgi:hypothetical protein
MGQQEYEAFKAKLREWMNTHPDEYAAFEEAMNARDYAGCQSVIFQAMSLIPRYRRLMSDKANEGLFEHVDEIEQAARQHDLAGKIIRECEQPGKDSTLPAMLCWLYFGKSFERMVERCEELRRSSDLGFLQKMTMSATIRLLISRSIKLELHTNHKEQQAFWHRHYFLCLCRFNFFALQMSAFFSCFQSHTNHGSDKYCKKYQKDCTVKTSQFHSHTTEYQKQQCCEHRIWEIAL